MEQLSYAKYGTNSQKIYDECCNSFGWKQSERGNFGFRKKLYAKDAAGDGLSVWFIAHSDWTETNKGDHINKLGFFCHPIIEEYLNNELPSETDVTNRIIFAKKKDGNYYFVGVFKVTKKNVRIREYKLLYRTYPFNQ